MTTEEHYHLLKQDVVDKARQIDAARDEIAALRAALRGILSIAYVTRADPEITQIAEAALGDVPRDSAELMRAALVAQAEADDAARVPPLPEHEIAAKRARAVRLRELALGTAPQDARERGKDER